MSIWKRRTWLGLVALAVIAVVGAACGETKEVVRTVEVEKPVIVEKEVIKEVPVERIVEKPVVQVVEKQVVVTKEVVKEVPKEVVVTKEVVKEVPREVVVVKEVIKEVPKEVVVTKEVVKEVVKEVIKEVPAKAKEKVLRVRMSSMPPAFSPHTGGSGAVTIVLGWTFSRLLQPNPTTGTWAPDLAAAYEVNADATAYTFFLQKHAVWHDGKPVTARDVAFTVKSFLNPQEAEWMINTYISVKGAKDFQQGKTKDVAGIQVIDDYTIKLTMERPNSTFLDELNTIAALSAVPVLPEHLLKDIPDAKLFEDTFWAQKLVGSGPFQFVQWVPQQFMELKAFDKFYFGRPKVDRIILAIIPSNDATQIAMQRGEIDVTVRGTVSLAAQKEFLQDPRFDVFAIEAGLILAYAWNDRIERLRDPRIREAFWIAIDERKICDRFQGGLCTVVGSPLVQKGVYKPEWNTRFQFNPDRARQLLKDAGWDSKQAITTTQAPITNDDVRAELAVRQQFLADVGIKWVIKEVDTAAGQDAWYDTHTAEMIGWAAGSMSDPNVFLTQNFGLTGGDNAFGIHITHPDFLAAIQEGAKIVDRTKRATYHQKFTEDFLWKYLPFTNVRQPTQVKIKSKSFFMPILGAIPKANAFKDMPVYPIHAGRDDNWIYHMEGWELRD